MPGEITKKQIDKMRKEFESDSSARVAQNAVTSNNPVSYTHLTLPTNREV